MTYTKSESCGIARGTRAPHLSLAFFTSFSQRKPETLNSIEMGIVVKLLDFTLFLFFLVIALAAPLFDAQACLPPSYFPDFLINLNKWYVSEFGDYLVDEKPHFFVGLVWFELLFQWPLVLFNLYGILAGKPWFKTTCLISGASFSTSMVLF